MIKTIVSLLIVLSLTGCTITRCDVAPYDCSQLDRETFKEYVIAKAPCDTSYCYKQVAAAFCPKRICAEKEE